MIPRTDNHDVYVTSNNNTTDVKNDEFEAKVLHYLKINHPTENLNTLLEKLKMLSPNVPLTLAVINKAVNVANEKMRNDPKHKEYADKILCKKSMQLTGTNVLYTNMMYEIFFPTDDDKSEIEKW